MHFETFPTGPLDVNCTILGCKETKHATVIDPGGDVDQIIALNKNENNTHER